MERFVCLVILKCRDESIPSSFMYNDSWNNSGWTISVEFSCIQLSISGLWAYVAASCPTAIHQYPQAVFVRLCSILHSPACTAKWGLPQPMGKTLHSALHLNLIRFTWVHCWSLSLPEWHPSQVCRLHHTALVSFTNFLNVHSIPLLMSLMKMFNKHESRY